MVKSCRNQKAFQKTIGKYACQTGCGNKAAQPVRRPPSYQRSDQTGCCHCHNYGNRYESFSSIKGNCYGKLYFMIFVMNLCSNQTGNNTCYRSHVQCFHTKNRGNLQRAEIHEPGSYHTGRCHQKGIVANKACKCRYFLFFLCKTKGNGNRKQHRDQGKNNACYLIQS